MSKRTKTHIDPLHITYSSDDGMSIIASPSACKALGTPSSNAVKKPQYDKKPKMRSVVVKPVKNKESSHRSQKSSSRSYKSSPPQKKSSKHRSPLLSSPTVKENCPAAVPVVNGGDMLKQRDFSSFFAYTDWYQQYYDDHYRQRSQEWAEEDRRQAYDYVYRYEYGSYGHNYDGYFRYGWRRSEDYVVDRRPHWFREPYFWPERRY